MLIKMNGREKMQKKGKIIKEVKNLRRLEDVEFRVRVEGQFFIVIEGRRRTGLVQGRRGLDGEKIWVAFFLRVVVILDKYEESYYLRERRRLGCWSCFREEKRDFVGKMQWDGFCGFEGDVVFVDKVQVELWEWRLRKIEEKKELRLGCGIFKLVGGVVGEKWQQQEKWQ